MNPLVQVTAAAGSTAAAADGSSSTSSKLLAGQDLVIATGLPLQQVGDFAGGVYRDSDVLPSFFSVVKGVWKAGALGCWSQQQGPQSQHCGLVSLLTVRRRWSSWMLCAGLRG